MPEWIGEGQKGRRRYIYGDTGWWIEHCGHPTALWPYAAYSPDGIMLLEPSGRDFQTVKRAKAAVEDAYQHPGHLVRLPRGQWTLRKS